MNDPQPSEAARSRRPQLSNLTSGLALAVSVFALAIGTWQTRLMQTQARASVWPYLSIGYTYSSDTDENPYDPDSMDGEQWQAGYDAAHQSDDYDASDIRKCHDELAASSGSAAVTLESVAAAATTSSDDQPAITRMASTGVCQRGWTAANDRGARPSSPIA